MKPSPPGVLIVTGPPGGMVLQPSGRIVSEYYTMAGPNGSYLLRHISYYILGISGRFRSNPVVCIPQRAERGDHSQFEFLFKLRRLYTNMGVTG